MSATPRPWIAGSLRGWPAIFESDTSKEAIAEFETEEDRDFALRAVNCCHDELVSALAELLAQIHHPHGIELADLDAAAERAVEVIARAKAPTP